MQISLMSGWIFLSPVFSLLQYIALLEVYKETLTSHRCIVEIVRSTSQITMDIL